MIALDLRVAARARASASTTRTGRPTPSPATASRWPSSARSSWPSAGSGSTPAPRWPARTFASASIAANTMLASAGGAFMATLWMWFIRGRKPDPSMMCNGMLAGLVAITAPCAFVSVLGGSRHRARVRDPGRRSSVLPGAQAQNRRSGRRNCGPRVQRRVGRHFPRAFCGRDLRRRVERRGGNGERAFLRRPVTAACGSHRGGDELCLVRCHFPCSILDRRPRPRRKPGQRGHARCRGWTSPRWVCRATPGSRWTSSRKQCFHADLEGRR